MNPLALPQLSQLQASEVRQALGPSWREVASIDVVVLAEGGDLPFVGRVQLGLMRRGRGDHLGLVCNGCDQPRGVLRLDGQGKLRCQFACHRPLTRQQKLRTTTAWALGGREVDALVRLLRKKHLTAGALARAEAIVEQLECQSVALVDNLAPTLALLRTAGHGTR